MTILEVFHPIQIPRDISSEPSKLLSEVFVTLQSAKTATESARLDVTLSLNKRSTFQQLANAEGIRIECIVGYN